jgi:sporulation protein YlmC with PRC-barrel domain
MRKIMLVTMVILTLIFGYTVTKSVAHEIMGKSGETSEVSNLLGTTVKNSEGEDLGTITDVVTGPEGRIAFAVLSYWVSSDTQMRVAVPFDALSCEEQNCVLNASKETFDSAPTFVSDDDLAERKLAEDIYRYFGVQPYWTEEGTLK